MKRFLSFCLAAVLLLACMVYAGETEPEEMNTAEIGTEVIGMSETDKEETLPEQDWQKSAVFPDWKGYTDDTLAMNSMLSFLSYHGQGELWLKVSDEVQQFSLYVNDVRYDTGKMGGGFWKADISGAAVDGVNTLQISNIMPTGLEKAVEVYVPYPVVLDEDSRTHGDADENIQPDTPEKRSSQKPEKTSLQKPEENSLRLQEGIHPETLELIADLIETDVEYGFPGASLAVIRNGRLVYENAWGSVRRYEPDGTPLEGGAPVTSDTLFDLASVTKMFSVNYAVQKLVTEGKLDADSPVVTILGDQFAEDTLDFVYADAREAADHETQIAWKKELTVRDVLCHQAGFPPAPAYYIRDYDMAAQSRRWLGRNLCYAENREETLSAICKTPLLYEPGTQTLYSDVDYILACFIIEKLTGKRLDAYMKETFFEPMGLEHITFLPLENGFEADDCAATELKGNTRDGRMDYDGIRTETLQGQVHDELAWYCMEGVSGHAGLFASATDLAKLASVMLTGGYGEHGFFARNVLESFTSPKSVDAGNWGLGWYRQGDDQRVWYFGTQASAGTIGHQGWTGTMVMIDPSRNLVISYLTNKIHSPVVDGSDQNQFAGNCYTASTLGFVSQILSIGMDRETDISDQLLDLLADMAAESLKLIPEMAGPHHPYVINARSKIQVLEKWANKAGRAETVSFAEELAEELPG